MSKPRHSNPQAEQGVTRRSLSMRAKSLGNFAFNRGSLKKGESQKEVVFPCETLQEDSQNETENIDVLVRRRRPLSAIEVFQHVDSRMPCNPPSYEQALQTGAQPAPPQYRAMTVQHARELDRKSRPISMNDYLLDNYKVNEPTEYIETFTESSIRRTTAGVIPAEGHVWVSVPVEAWASPIGVASLCLMRYPMQRNLMCECFFLNCSTTLLLRFKMKCVICFWLASPCGIEKTMIDFKQFPKYSIHCCCVGVDRMIN